MALDNKLRRRTVAAVLSALLMCMISPAMVAAGAPPPKPESAHGRVVQEGVTRPAAKPAHRRAARTATPPQVDSSTGLPRTVRDEITGDFMGLGYDQHMRAENSELNIYNPPGKGGGLLQSTPLDLVPPGNRSVPLWSNWGSERYQNCSSCFSTLDGYYHLATIQLAYDGDHIYIAGTKGLDFTPGQADSYVNVLYMVTPDGKCASSACAQSVAYLNTTYTTPDGYERSVGTISLAAGRVNGTPYVAVGGSDYGVSIYGLRGISPGQLTLTASYAAMAIVSDPGTQTPVTALAWDPSGSGLLAVGVTEWAYVGYFATITEQGTVANSVTWGQIGSSGPNGQFGATPNAAAIGKRPNSTNPVVAFAMTDGTVRLLDPTSSNPTPLSQTATLPGEPVAINPIARLDGSGTTDYAVALQGSGFGSGYGVFMTDGGSTTLTPNVVGVDGSGNPTTTTSSLDAYRAWFPGYKEGRFTLQNNSPYPVTVTLAQSSSSGKGCWFAPSWADGGQQFPADGVDIAPGQSAGVFSMGAYTAGSNGKCSADPDLHKESVWRAYLVFSPQTDSTDPSAPSLAGETRLVDVQLDPKTWTIDIGDQQGGSLPVSKTVDGEAAAFGDWTFTLGGAVAPSAIGTAPTLTGYQLTPAVQNTPSVYRFDVGPTTWSVPGLGGSPRQVEALIPPLQVQGRVGTGKWANVGQLLPTGKLNVSGTTVTVPGASFFWENAIGSPQYSQFQVSTGGSNTLTSTPVVNLNNLTFCYTGTGTACLKGPDVEGVSITNTNSLRPMMANGLDQMQVIPSIALQDDSGGGALPAGDDGYNKVFYRQGNASGPLVTNLYRQDLKTCQPYCYSSFVGVQPNAGAYLNTGGNTLIRSGRGVRGLSGSPTDYVSTNSSTAVTLVALVSLAGTKPYKSSTFQASGYPLDPAVSGTAVGGFSISGCTGEINTSSSCLIVPTASSTTTPTSRAALFQAGAPDSGPILGALFANQAQNSVEDLPMTWPDTAAQLLDDPVLLTYNNTPTYVWKLPNASGVLTAHSDVAVVTHGEVVNETVCTAACGT